MDTKPRTFTREALYELIWSHPMVGVSLELGISDVGLAKRCRNVKIPVPPRGDGAKVEAGQAPPNPPLPLRRSAISARRSSS